MPDTPNPFAGCSWPGVLPWLVNGLSQFPQVQRVLLFGSRARGDFRPRSDIDLAVVGQFSDETWVALLDVVDDAPTLLKIDLVHYNEANPTFKACIDEDAQCLFDRSTL